VSVGAFPDEKLLMKQDVDVLILAIKIYNKAKHYFNLVNIFKLVPLHLTNLELFRKYNFLYLIIA
jgi:hypothetical protein